MCCNVDWIYYWFQIAPKVQKKEGSALKRFNCPYELKDAEIDNPHLQLIQAISLQVLIEMEEADKEVLVENNMKSIVINPEFYKRLFNWYWRNSKIWHGDRYK